MPEACHSLATNYIFSALGHKITRFLYELQGFLQSFTRFSTELYKVFYRGTRFSIKDRYSGVTNQIIAFVTTRI